MGWYFAFVSRARTTWQQLHTSTENSPESSKSGHRYAGRSGGGIQLVNGRAADFLAPLQPPLHVRLVPGADIEVLSDFRLGAETVSVRCVASKASLMGVEMTLATSGLTGTISHIV